MSQPGEPRHHPENVAKFPEPLESPIRELAHVGREARGSVS